MRLRLFAATLLVSAALLFLVEPMFAKMVLPRFGGTAAVWITCMVFYQAGLLAGYAYAHWTTEHLGARRQAALHMGVLLLALVVLPIQVRSHWSPPTDQNPTPWLLAILLVSVGLPFFVLSTATPALQMWYASTGRPDAQDPYFLYSASNLGSLLGLLSYPVLVEPHLRLIDQSRLWTCGYWLLVALTLACAADLWRSGRRRAHNPAHPSPADGLGYNSSPLEGATKPSASQRLRWVALAFVPASLMLGVTTRLTTDFPPVPFFWVLPLTVYLLTFVLVFAAKPRLDHENLVARLPLLLLLAVFPTISKTLWPAFLTLVLYLLALFVTSMVFHGELARTRPPTAYLTGFYLYISLGGVLGGIFNALLAPLIFKQVLEYPLALVLAAFLRPSTNSREPNARARLLDLVFPLSLGALLVTLIEVTKALALHPSELLTFLTFAPALVACLSFGKRPWRFGLGFTALFLASMVYAGAYGKPLYAARSFFGVYQVTTDPLRRFHLLVNGSTIHGRQSLDPSRAREPLSYYSRTGPIGQVFGAYSGTEDLQRVAIVGLGAGAIASYGQSGQEFTFYEIDPVVERVARDSRYFTYLRDSRADIRVVLGDARLSLRGAPDRVYGLIVLDAFNSDAVPLHLLTREALRLYLTKLSDHGILAFHISNRYLDLRPAVAALARDAGVACLLGDDSKISADAQNAGKDPSLWVVMARQQTDLGKLPRGGIWTNVREDNSRRVWTDDFSNILSAVRWWN